MSSPPSTKKPAQPASEQAGSGGFSFGKLRRSGSRQAAELAREQAPTAVYTCDAEGRVETIAPQMQARRHELEISVGHEPLWVEGDPTRLEQLIAGARRRRVWITTWGSRSTTRNCSGCWTVPGRRTVCRRGGIDNATG